MNCSFFINDVIHKSFAVNSLTHGPQGTLVKSIIKAIVSKKIIQSLNWRLCCLFDQELGLLLTASILYFSATAANVLDVGLILQQKRG